MSTAKELKKIKLFSKFSEEELERFLSLGKIVTYEKDQLILEENQPGNEFLLIVSGKIEIVKDDCGEIWKLAVMGSGDFVGEMSMFDGFPRSASVKTVEPTKVFMITREDFLNQLKIMPTVALELLKELTVRIRKINEQFITDMRTQNILLENANNDLHKLDDMKAKFVNITSHELKTPMTVLTNCISILKTEIDHGENEMVGKVLSYMEEGIERLDRLIAHIVKISRHIDQDIEIFKLDFSLNELLQKVADEMAIFIEKRNQVLEMNLDPTDKIIYSDQEKIRQIAESLMLNAIKFTPDGGTIKLLSRFEDNAAIIGVEDNGIGISDDKKADIFKAFYEGGNTMYHSSGTYEFQSGGLGLGLAICNNFIELLGGQIGVESEEGEGSNFEVMIPYT